MYRKQFGRVIVHVKRALRKDRRLTVEEFNQLLQLSEAIIDYGRMIKEHRRYSVPNVILEITELANRFRETPQTIKDAHLLLRDIVVLSLPIWTDVGDCNLAGALLSDRKGFHSAMRHSHSFEDDTSDPGTA